MTEEQIIQEARAHLAAALAQVAPSDDEIIVNHLRKAHNLLVQMSVKDFLKEPTHAAIPRGEGA